MYDTMQKEDQVARDFLTISFLIFSIIKQTTSLFPWRHKTESSHDPSLITCRLPTTAWPCPAGEISPCQQIEMNITECHQIQQIISLHFDSKMFPFELYWSKSANHWIKLLLNLIDWIRLQLIYDDNVVMLSLIGVAISDNTLVTLPALANS